ncbi:MAG: ATP-binding protein [Muribaculaceae bacterium]|nr:ATP-binding protein [Muribaculaceae bacterium]
MEKNIKYPVGIQTFPEIIEENYFYVDKTQLVYNLTQESKYIFLSRPRRFGKSLLMSTLEAYFKGRKELFIGLKITEFEKDWSEFPVFRFDLSGENYINTTRLVDNIGFYLDKFELTYGISSYGSIATRFKQLVLKANLKYGKKVVVLIDEYDKPLLDCLHNPSLHDELKNELRSFYSCIKACDEYIRFAMLTGVSKFGKVSIFSGLNNLKDISLLPKYNALCGISESEFHRDFVKSIDEFSEVSGISTHDAWNSFKEMYDGYHFAAKGEYIYNPFSILNAFDQNEFKSFWYESGSPTYLVRLIESNSYNLDRLEGQHRTEEQLGNITDMQYDLVPLLFQSGYLTIKGYDSETREYKLGFPNREVYESFWTSLKNHFFRAVGGGNAFDLRLFYQDIIDGNPEEFMRRLKALFADTSSEPERNKEIHFQNMMAIVAKMLGLKVITEVQSAAGRCDMQILTDRFVYIFEFKIDSIPQEALEQIRRKGYAEPFNADSRTCFIIGANFSISTRGIDNWIIEKLYN